MSGDGNQGRRPTDERLAQMRVQAEALLDDQLEGIEYMDAHVREGIANARAAAVAMCEPGSSNEAAGEFLKAFVELHHRWAALSATAAQVVNQLAIRMRRGGLQPEPAPLVETPEQLIERRKRMN